jgi:hypothetical protein
VQEFSFSPWQYPLTRVPRHPLRVCVGLVIVFRELHFIIAREKSTERFLILGIDVQINKKEE